MVGVSIVDNLALLARSAFIRNNRNFPITKPDGSIYGDGLCLDHVTGYM